MRSPSWSHPHARRVRRHLQSLPVVSIAVCAAFFVAVGCARAQELAPSPTAASSVQAAAPGIPLYSVEARNFAFDAMPSVVPANKQFQLSFTNNETFPVTHEMVVLKLPAGKNAQDVINDASKKGPKAERDWVHVGDAPPLPLHASAVLTLTLPPGNYAATCWQTGKAGGGTGPPHVALGMIATFTASASASASAAPTGPIYSVSVKNFIFQGVPATVQANQPFEVSFLNDEGFPIEHEFVVLKLPPGKTAQDVVNDAKKKGPKAEDDWVHVGDSGAALPVGASAVLTLNLRPGNYVATCWQTGKVGGGTGPPHLTIGMIAPFSAVNG
jgi:hypothetical protein